MRKPLAALVVLTLSFTLASCGGGGDGSTVPVPAGPSTNPAPGPSGTPASSASPLPSPTPTSAPTATPTPLPTATPTPAATATPMPSGGPDSQQTLHAGDGTINGTDDQFTPTDGDMTAGTAGAQPNGGGQGPTGATVDGIPCLTSMSNDYHVHAFVGAYVNGQEIAIPDAIGMYQPQQGELTYGGYPNQVEYATCFYEMHTHDASGMVHLEASSPTCGVAAGPTAPPCETSIFTLGNFFDIWGISVTPASFGPFQGPVTIYTSPQQYEHNCNPNCYTGSSTYSLYTGDPSQIPLYSHEVVWILVGTGNPTGNQLPNIEWYAAY